MFSSCKVCCNCWLTHCITGTQFHAHTTAWNGLVCVFLHIWYFRNLEISKLTMCTWINSIHYACTTKHWASVFLCLYVCLLMLILLYLCCACGYGCYCFFIFLLLVMVKNDGFCFLRSCVNVLMWKGIPRHLCRWLNGCVAKHNFIWFCWSL